MGHFLIRLKILRGETNGDILAVSDIHCAGDDGFVRASERSGGRETEASSTGTNVRTTLKMKACSSLRQIQDNTHE